MLTENRRAPLALIAYISIRADSRNAILLPKENADFNESILHSFHLDFAFRYITLRKLREDVWRWERHVRYYRRYVSPFTTCSTLGDISGREQIRNFHLQKSGGTTLWRSTKRTAFHNILSYLQIEERSSSVTPKENKTPRSRHGKSTFFIFSSRN